MCQAANVRLMLLFLLALLSNCTRVRATDGLTADYWTPLASGSGDSILEPYATLPPSKEDKVDPTPSRVTNTVINYLSAFPCTDADFREAYGDEHEALRLMQTCDVFAYVASELATQHVNQHRQGIFTYPDTYQLPDTTLKQHAGRGTKTDLAYATFHFLKNIDKYTTHGQIIGPSDSEVAVFSLANFGTRYNTAMITYGATSPQLSDRQRFPNLHQTTPTTTLVNLARLRLLREFDWKRCAVLSSPGFPHFEILRELIDLAGNERSSVDLNYYGTFDQTAVHVLDETRKDDMRIFILISDEVGTRNTLCEAHRRAEVPLTGSAYVWIVSSFYNRQWWQLDSKQIAQLHKSQNCSNYEMEEILNTTHVISASIYHYQYGSLDTGWNQTVNITHGSFLEMVQNLTRHYLPSLSNTSLLPYLVHSQAASAYDAVWALSRAWHVAIPTLNYSHNIHTEMSDSDRRDIIATVINQALNGTLRDGIINHDPSYFQGVSGHHDFTKDSNYYGKVLISQYIGAREIPIALYRSTPMESGTSQQALGDLIYIKESEDDEWLFEPPQDFLWIAGHIPFDEVMMQYSHIPLPAVTVVLIVVLLSVVFAAVIGIASLVYRNNKHIRASSPWLSYLVLLGLVLMMPFSLQLGLVNSSHSEKSLTPDILSPLCKAGYIFSSTGQTLAFAVLLVKNWRLYKIFYNSTLKRDLPRYLSDKYLLLIAVLLVVPHLLMHLIWQLVHPLHFKETTYTLSPTTSLSITYCSSDNLVVWEFLSIAYFGALSIVLLFLSLQNNRIPAHFSEEGNQSSVSVLITLVVFVPSLMFLPCLDSDPRLYRHKFWLTALVSVVLPDILLATLFVRKFVLIWCEWRRHARQRRARNQNEERHVQLAHLEEQASKLKLELEETEKRVNTIRQRQLQFAQDRSNSSTSAASTISGTSTTGLLAITNTPSPTESTKTTSTQTALVEDDNATTDEAVASSINELFFISHAAQL